MKEERGKVIVIVAPSGTGKSTLIKKVKTTYPELYWSVSCTTRPARPGEEDGKDYFFLSKHEFEKKIDQKDYIEWALVHGHYYGTSKSFIDSQLDQGYFVLADLDVQGADAMRAHLKDDTVCIFITPPGPQDLEKRLRKRATDSEEVIQIRLKNAREELKRKNDYDYLVVNDEIEKAYKKLCDIISDVMGASRVEN